MHLLSALLKKINKMTTIIEKEIYNSMKNKQLIQLLELEKSLVYFSTSLKANETCFKLKDSYK